MLFTYNVRFTGQEAIYLYTRLLTEHYILTNYLILENGIENNNKKERAFTDYIYIPVSKYFTNELTNKNSLLKKYS
jgi:hypothetical protein